MVMSRSDCPVTRGPRPRPRASWAEREQRRRRQRWRQLLDDSFGMRLLLATGAATLLLVSVNRWEHCRKTGFSTGCLLADAGGVVVDEVPLELLNLLVGEDHLGELPDAGVDAVHDLPGVDLLLQHPDRKSTRLNSSHRT